MDNKPVGASIDPLGDFLRAKFGRDWIGRLTSDHLQQYLDEYLSGDDRRPSRDQLTALVQELNHIAERPGGADAPVTDEAKRRLAVVLEAVQQCRGSIRAYRDWAALLSDYPSFDEQDECLAKVDIRPALLEPLRVKMGRPRERWHRFGRIVADRIGGMMREAGYRGSLSEQREESITAAVSARVMQHFMINVTASGFAAAMKERQRRQH